MRQQNWSSIYSFGHYICTCWFILRGRPCFNVWHTAGNIALTHTEATSRARARGRARNTNYRNDQDMVAVLVVRRA